RAQRAEVCMDLEWIAIAAGIVGGALFFLGLYLLAIRKAAKSGERAFVIFMRGVLFLALMHGLGLVVVTGAVLFCVPLLLGQIPEADCDFMEWMILAGLVLVCIGGVGLRFTWWTAKAERGHSSS